MLMIAAKKPPHINALDPATGAIAESIVIRGSGFSAGPGSNHVFFDASSGAVEAPVLLATATALTVSVPLGAVSGPVYVIVGRNTSNSMTFTITTPQPPPVHCGVTVTGVVNVVADATDNVGVFGVQLQLDGINLGSELLVPPYVSQWLTTNSANGCHNLSATARDAAGNRSTAAMQVWVQNP